MTREELLSTIADLGDEISGLRVTNDLLVRKIALLERRIESYKALSHSVEQSIESMNEAIHDARRMK